MTRRSVTNDRYRVEQKGKTRKSASAAKPKRAAGETTSASGKSAAKPRSALSRAFGGGGQATSPARVEDTPEIKKLARVSWVLLGVALVFVLVMMQTEKLAIAWLSRALFGGYALTIGGSMYIMLGPLRRMRVEAAAAAKKGGKGSKDSGKDAKKSGATSA